MQPTPIYQEIAEAVRRQIASGELAPGARLPAVREMARRWHCTPGTVSRAYAVLAEEGLLSGHRGGGTRVSDGGWGGERTFLQWAALINRAEQFLLEALAQGHEPAQAQAALSVAIGRWQTLQAPTASAGSLVLRFAGSHDLAIDLLAQQLAAQIPEARLEARFTGSLGGLWAVARGEADIAGTHLYDEATGAYNHPFVQRMLPGQQLALVTLARRSLGLIVPPGNPAGLTAVADLARPGLVVANRQAGSGTRVWLEAQLRALGVETAVIQGYARELPTHMAVAQAVHSGQAGAGLGIHAAAMAYGLDFVPLTQEVYQLIIPQMVWDTAVCQTLIAIIRSRSFQQEVEALGGYETAISGNLTWI